ARRARFVFSNKHINVLSDFPSLCKNAIPNAGMCREQSFESILKRVARCFHVHMTTPNGHGCQWPWYPKMDRHPWLLFRPFVVPFCLETLPFSFFGEARLRFSVGLGVEGPASSATTALATHTICGRPLSISFQVLPASLDAYTFPLRVPK